MTDSKISFSKEIAESIGLGEAIILEQINQSSLQNKTSSLDNICSNLSFINPNEIEELLTKLIKIGLIVCLLYTSPSPRDLLKSRMPSSA